MYLGSLFQVPLNGIELNHGSGFEIWRGHFQLSNHSFPGIGSTDGSGLASIIEEVWGGREEIGRTGYFYEEEGIETGARMKL